MRLKDRSNKDLVAVDLVSLSDMYLTSMSFVDLFDEHQATVHMVGVDILYLTNDDKTTMDVVAVELATLNLVPVGLLNFSNMNLAIDSLVGPSGKDWLLWTL